MVVQLLGDENDVLKWGKTRERAEKSMMYHTIPQLSLQDTPAFKGDNENDRGSAGAILNAESSVRSDFVW